MGSGLRQASCDAANLGHENFQAQAARLSDATVPNIVPWSPPLSLTTAQVQSKVTREREQLKKTGLRIQSRNDICAPVTSYHYRGGQNQLNPPLKCHSQGKDMFMPWQGQC